MLNRFAQLFVVLIGITLVASVPLPTQAALACGWWGSSVDKSVPVMSVVPSKVSPSDGECTAYFTFTNETELGAPFGLLTLVEGHSLLLSAESGVAEFEWQSLGSPDPAKAVLLSGGVQKIKVSTKRPDLPATVYIHGTWADTQLLKIDLTRYLLKSLLDLIPIPANCGISKSELLMAYMKDPDNIAKMSKTLAAVADLASKGDMFQAEQELNRAWPIFIDQVVQIGVSIGGDCLEKGLEKFLGKRLENAIGLALIKIKIIGAFLTYEGRWVFDYARGWGNNLAKGELIYHPLETPVPAPVVPVPIPVPVGTPCAPLNITKREPQDGQVFSGNSLIFEWWTDYPMQPGEYFDVQVWPEGESARSIGVGTQVKNGGWRFPVENLNGWSRGKYFWTVRAKASEGGYRTCEAGPFWIRLVEKGESGPQPPSRSSSSSYWSHR